MPSITIDTKTQVFYSTAQPEADVCVIHTTEGMGWPGYSGGGAAPHATIRAIPGKGIAVRKHIGYDKFAKALMNLPGGVETNRRGALQFELIGTCDPKHKGDSDWYSWADADDVVLEALADFLRPVLSLYKIPHRAPAFLAYPASYANKQGQRFSFAEWNAFNGICGHQHVPENVHGDPGAFPIAKLLKFLGASGASVTKPASSIPSLPKPKTVWGRGDTGTKVREIQGKVGVPVDGDFGPATEAAVKRFQTKHGLDADGLWGPQCDAVKATAPKPASKPAAKPSTTSAPRYPGLLKRGSKGSYVTSLQSRLKARGWNVKVDGDFGKTTEGIVRQFQAEKHLGVDGKVGPQTWAAIFATANVTR